MSKFARQLAGWFSGAGLQEKTREPEPVHERRGMTSFFGSLTKEQQERALAYRGEEDHGDEAMRRR